MNFDRVALLVLVSFGAVALNAAPAQAQVIATPDTGTADAGTGSRPVANVAANDTVNGAAAVLGAGGNATLNKIGTWPAGIAFNPANGQVTTNVSVQAGTYSGQYRICDASSASSCATTTVTVNVINASVLAVDDSGTADVGIASRPIANVAANDTINGQPATLGASGNATVAKGTAAWPAGLGLNTSTGAVSTTTATPQSTYTVQYQLCDKNSPPVCSTANVTVTVVSGVVIANPENGTADAGIASKAIANVAANDTISGAPAVLGTAGNATVQIFNGPWPAGITLTPSTGQVSTTVDAQPGQYSIQYQLCDRNVPVVCAQATDQITITNPNIVANPDTGSAPAGVGAKPIANVTANDTVNGAPVTLGSGGNATISQSQSLPWPSGIVLNTATGAVSTSATLAGGVYNVQYQLCDLNVPPACATGKITVTLNTSIVANPDSGFIVAGNSGIVIANVSANDFINGAAAILGSSGNASVAPFDGWPAGITLDPFSGAVSVSASVPPLTYALKYELCDLSSSQNCNAGNITLTVNANYAEVQASTQTMGDLEFDWGRDGIYCPSCNFGDSNARGNWTDRLGNIWIAHLDPNSGQFVMANAQDEQVDPGKANAFFWNAYGNGPEWAFSTQNGQVSSQLVYSRYAVNDPTKNPAVNSNPAYTGAAYATQTGFNTWTSGFLPGAINKGNGTPGTNNTNLPEASQCNSDPVASVMFKNFASPLQLFTEPVTTAAGTTPLLAPFTSNGIGERFVPCTHQLLYQADTVIAGTTVQQVFWYNADTGVSKQLTFDSTSKSAGFMFQAPDFNHNYIFFTLAKQSDHTTIQVYQQSGTNADGSPTFGLVNQIVSPDPNEPYMNSAEPFIHCTPTCRTYVFTTLSKTPDSQNGVSEPNGLAVVALDPNNPLFNVLAQAGAFPFRQRLDAEYYITPNGAYLYYNNIIPQTGVSNYKNLGEWYIDMQLGVPSGACVGSSAQGGLLPGC